MSLRRTRCPEHGLFVQAEGRCLLCRDAAAHRPQRTWLHGLLLIGLVSLSTWWVRRDPGRAASPPRQVERAPAQTESRNSVQPASGSDAVERDERAFSVTEVPALVDTEGDAEPLRAASDHAHEISAPAPPEPPRASVDPEPFLPDDPRDFDLR